MAKHSTHPVHSTSAISVHPTSKPPAQNNHTPSSCSLSLPSTHSLLTPTSCPSNRDTSSQSVVHPLTDLGFNQLTNCTPHDFSKSHFSDLSTLNEHALDTTASPDLQTHLVDAPLSPRRILDHDVAVPDNENRVADALRLDPSTINPISSSSTHEDLMECTTNVHVEPGQASKTPVLIECKHWLEMQDKYHRYGTYLKPYYDLWLSQNCEQPFFHWLDLGDGLTADSSPKFRTRRRSVSRDVLDTTRVHYCTESERESYKVRVRESDGCLVWASKTPLAPGASFNEVVDTTGDDDRWIFVIDAQGECLVNRKVKGLFHHSSFVAGEPVRAAGRISVRQGRIASVGPNSGHYRTTREQLVHAVHNFFDSVVPIAEIPIANLSMDGNSE